MIGFLPQTTNRRPIYSLTGQKLCYLVSGPDGEWIYRLDGEKHMRVVARKHKWLAELTATASLTSGLMTERIEDIYEI